MKKILALLSLVALFTYASALSFPKLVGRRWAVGGQFNEVQQPDGTKLPVGNFAAWNGTQWSSYDGGVTDEVKKVVVDACRNVYIGGDFQQSVTGAATGPLAVWYKDSDKWEALGSYDTFTGSVYDISVDCFNIVDVLGRSCNCDVYIAGDFTMKLKDGTTATNVAKYDANDKQWSNIGAPSLPGDANVIYKKSVPNSVLDKSVRVVHVAGKGFYKLYNTKDKTWTDATPEGFTGKFEAIEYDSEFFTTDRVFLAGEFNFTINTAKTDYCTNVCEYNRQTKEWSKLLPADKAPNKIVKDLKLIGDKLYMVGEFTNTGTPGIATVSTKGASALQAATSSDNVVSANDEELRSIDVCSKTDLYCKEGSMIVGSKDALLKFYDSSAKAWVNFGEVDHPFSDNDERRVNSVLTWNYIGAASASTVFGISSAFVMFAALIAMLF